MTVASTTRKTALFAGDNATTDFPFTFKVFAVADLLVVRRTIATGVETELTLTTHYTVTLNADQEANPGGIVALVAPLLDTYNLIISSKVSILQPAALANQGGFYPKVIMDALDRLTIISQQLKEEIDRCAKAPITYPEYADLLDDIATLATQTGDIETVADNIGEVVATGGSIANVNAVAADLSNVDIVAGDIANINAVVPDIANVNAVANDLTNVDMVAENIEDINEAGQGIIERMPIRDTARNLVIKNNATHADHQVDIDADEIILQDDSGLSLRVSAVDLTVDIAASGANGLDTGAEDNVLYYIWVINNGTTTAALLSESSTAPTLPSGYTFKALVGAVRNVSSDFKTFGQIGSVVAHSSITALLSGSETSFTAVDLTGLIPATAKAITGYAQSIKTSATACDIEISPHSDGSTGAVVIKQSGASGTQIASGYFKMPLLTALTIWYRTVSGSESYIFITGWEY